MSTIIDQEWKKKDNICMLFALAKRNNSKHVKLVKRVIDVVDKVEQIKVFTDHEVKGRCDHAMGIVSEGDGGECKLYDNTWTVPVKS